MTMHKFEASIPLDESWDVVVVGGGPAGCTAAAAAAREGARTLLLETTGSLGGMGTNGLVPAWCPFSDREKIIYCGLAEKVFHTATEPLPHVARGRTEWVPIDAERLKRVYDDLVTGAGASILFNTFVSAVQHDGDGRVTTLVAANKAGLTAYRARQYVDCTGDADLAAWAGAQFHKGDDEGDLQPATLCFTLANVDIYAFVNDRRCVWGGSTERIPVINQIVASGKYPLIPDTHACNNIVGPGCVGFNTGHLWGVDNTDPVSVSKALIQGRKMAESYRQALAEYYPTAFANSFLVSTGSLMGIRETRRIIGDYYLTLADFKARMSFPDEICRNSYFVDVHHKKNEIPGSERGKVQTEVAVPIIYLGKGESHGIPYRCLTPKGLRNVMVAGRAISCDRPVQGSVRVMPTCLVMGEAAGLAAAMCVQQGLDDIHTLDPQKLRHRLKDYGAYLPEIPPGPAT